MRGGRGNASKPQRKRLTVRYASTAAPHPDMKMLKPSARSPRSVLGQSGSVNGAPKKLKTVHGVKAAPPGFMINGPPSATLTQGSRSGTNRSGAGGDGRRPPRSRDDAGRRGDGKLDLRFFFRHDGPGRRCSVDGGRFRPPLGRRSDLVEIVSRASNELTLKGCRLAGDVDRIRSGTLGNRFTTARRPERASRQESGLRRRGKDRRRPPRGTTGGGDGPVLVRCDPDTRVGELHALRRGSPLSR